MEGNEGTLEPARGRRWWKKRGQKRRVRIQPRRGFPRESAARGPDLEGGRSETGSKNPWELQANADGNIGVRGELDRRRKALESNHLRMANGKREGVQERRTAAGDDRLRRGRHRGWKVMAPEGKPEEHGQPERDEPQDRQRGATNPQDTRRRKPSRW